MTNTTIDTNILLTNMISAMKKQGKKQEAILESVKLARETLAIAIKYPKLLSRKTMKYPVMLVSSYGAKQTTTTAKVREAMEEMCGDIPEILSVFNNEQFNMFCRLVHLQVGVVLPAANDYLAWANKLLGVVSKVEDGIHYNQPLSGYPVNIVVNKTEEVKIQYKVFGRNTMVNAKKHLKEVNHQKTTTSAVPQIIHSIDAGILIKTGERFQNSMSLIHDSFGTGFNKMSDMKTAINESLLEVAESTVMQDIADQLTKNLNEESISEMITKEEEKLAELREEQKEVGEPATVAQKKAAKALEAKITSVKTTIKTNSNVIKALKKAEKEGFDYYTAPMANTFKGNLEKEILASKYAFS